MKDYMDKVLPLGSVVRLGLKEEEDVEYVITTRGLLLDETHSMIMVECCIQWV